jgi:hypothetical protein
VLSLFHHISLELVNREMDLTPFNKINELPIPLSTDVAIAELRLSITKLSAYRLH